jgi:hypothetical protein
MSVLNLDPLRGPNGYPLRSSDILALFGLPPNAAIPADYAASQEINGVLVTIRPKDRSDFEIKRRVVATCPVCAALVCAGHLHQHMRVHR